MKKENRIWIYLLTVLVLLLMLTILQSLIQIKPQNEVNFYELKQNETITFNDGPTTSYENYSGSFNRAAYDKSSYTIKLNKAGNLNVSDINGCSGNHQNEIVFYNCSGTISRNFDTIKIYTKTIYRKLYLFNLEKNGIVDSLTSDVQIKLISRTLKNEYCPTLVTTGSTTNIIALPKKINTKEIYKPSHKDKTIGIFTYLAINYSDGKSKVYPTGDYVLIGGNSLNISNK